MDIEAPNPQSLGVPDNDSGTARGILERGAEAYGQAGEAVGDAFDKTAHRLTETYEQTRNYSRKHPNQAIFIALGIGAGLGFLLSARSRPSRTGRFARPVVKALSEVALEFLR
jgi:ElaB/YqjD/DUF883 family membrane-anchored ribosome-binding protein